MSSMTAVTWAVGLAGVLAAAPAGAQTDERRVYTSRASPVLAGLQPPDVAFFDVVAGFGGAVVEGAPYSADAETEFVQTLADGNRIVRGSSSTVHRDAQGRTRREVGLALVGPLTGSEEPPRRIVIDDPLADESWVLDPESRTARRQPRLRVSWTPKEGDAAAPVIAPGGGPGTVFIRGGPGEGGEPPVLEHVQVEAVGAAPHHDTFVAEPPHGGRLEEESLGLRDFSGVSAEGTRRTVTIPAGQIGNEKPIEITTERWYSEELRTVVLSVRSDPRVGETTFRLRNLRLGDPDPALFEVPSDWTVEDAPGPGAIVIHEERDEPE